MLAQPRWRGGWLGHEQVPADSALTCACMNPRGLLNQEAGTPEISAHPPESYSRGCCVLMGRTQRGLMSPALMFTSGHSDRKGARLACSWVYASGLQGWSDTPGRV